MGDVLFALVNLSRHVDVDAEGALRRTIDKFTRRFAHVEKRVREEHGGWGEARAEARDAPAARGARPATGKRRSAHERADRSCAVAASRARTPPLARIPEEWAERLAPLGGRAVPRASRSSAGSTRAACSTRRR